jgi:hypothetical protein
VPVIGVAGGEKSTGNTPKIRQKHRLKRVRNSEKYSYTIQLLHSKKNRAKNGQKTGKKNNPPQKKKKHQKKCAKKKVSHSQKKKKKNRTHTKKKKPKKKKKKKKKNSQKKNL